MQVEDLKVDFLLYLAKKGSTKIMDGFSLISSKERKYKDNGCAWECKKYLES